MTATYLPTYLPTYITCFQVQTHLTKAAFGSFRDHRRRSTSMEASAADSKTRVGVDVINKYITLIG